MFWQLSSRNERCGSLHTCAGNHTFSCLHGENKTTTKQVINCTCLPTCAASVLMFRYQIASMSKSSTPHRGSIVCLNQHSNLKNRSNRTFTTSRVSRNSPTPLSLTHLKTRTLPLPRHRNSNRNSCKGQIATPSTPHSNLEHHRYLSKKSRRNSTSKSSLSCWQHSLPAARFLWEFATSMRLST